MQDRQAAFRLRHAPLRRWSDIIGHLCNEMLLQPEVVSVAAAADGLDGLAALVRAHGDLTCVSMALLIALRRSGRLGLPAELSSEARTDHVPARIFQYWESEISPDLRGAMEDLQARNPWAVYRRFDRASAGEYLAGMGRPEVALAFRLCRHAAQRADLFRLAVMWAEGGIYLDADNRCGGNLAGLLPPGARLVLYQEHLGSIANNFIAAAPGCGLLERTMQQIAEALIAGAGEYIWLLSGPGALTRALARRIAETPDIALPQDCHVLLHSTLLGRVAPQCPFAYKIGPGSWARG